MLWVLESEAILNNGISDEERKNVVLGTHEEKNMYGIENGKPTDRYFIYDCNNSSANYSTDME